MKFLIVTLLFTAIFATAPASADEEDFVGRGGGNDNCTTIYPKDKPFFTGNYASARAHTEKTTLRVVSYNVNYLPDTGAVLKDLANFDELKNADFILLQEATGETSGAANQVDVLARALKMNYVFAPGGIAYWLDPQKDYGNAVLSRWPITAQTKVLLPLSGKEKCNQRTAVGVMAHVGDRVIQVFSIHLSTQFPDTFGGEASRAAQMEAAIEQINKRAEIPAIIAGDLNTVNPWGRSKLEKMMMEDNHFIDAHTAPGSTSRTHDVVIDHAYARGLTHEADGTVSKAEASDHYPIWMQVSFKD